LKSPPRLTVAATGTWTARERILNLNQAREQILNIDRSISRPLDLAFERSRALDRVCAQGVAGRKGGRNAEERMPTTQIDPDLPSSPYQ
jgi:hypothetical protein